MEAIGEGGGGEDCHAGRWATRGFSTVPRMVDPSMKVTVPIGENAASDGTLETVAVNVTHLADCRRILAAGDKDGLPGAFNDCLDQRGAGETTEVGATDVHVGGYDVVISDRQRGSGVGGSGLVRALVNDGNGSLNNRNTVHRKGDRAGKRTGSCASGDGGSEGNRLPKGGWIDAGVDDYGRGIDRCGIAYQDDVERCVDGDAGDIDVSEAPHRWPESARKPKARTRR